MSEVEKNASVSEEDQDSVIDDQTGDVVFSLNSKRVYVGNIAYKTIIKDLHEHMSSAGTVINCEILLMHNRRSKGSALVEFSSEDEAINAINTLNDTMLDDRMIFVREDREPAQRGTHDTHPLRPPFSVQSKRCYSCNQFGHFARDCISNESDALNRFNPRTCFQCGDPDHLIRDCYQPDRDRVDIGTKLFISNLSYQMAWQDLKDEFISFGPIIRANVLTQHDGRSKGVGVVIFENAQDAHQAIEDMDGIEIFGRIISVRLDRYANYLPNSSS